MAADTKAFQDILKASEDNLLKAFDTATEHFCPNRVWAVAKEDLPKLIPDDKTIRGPDNQDKHEQCTFDFCEQSRRDFTAVEQRHECKEKECLRLQWLFSRDILKDAAETGKSTVWTLDGRSTLKFSLPYMAISHVWSDGTGTGAWAEGEVNKCLYTFFQGIANQFQCEGIWWDTLCIPREKAARNKAIQKIQSNYQDARITLVHDCFLRNWKWTNAEAACFAILMSPWFSRGWTALELAKSRKVKVVFNGSHGPLIKDLDEEILAKATDPANDPKPSSHEETTKMIKSLRKGITELDDLLKVLGPRFTSWPKDIAIISGLLVGTKVAPEDGQQDVLQQDIYKSILRKIGKVSSRHLFHNSATMSRGFSWCPTNLFNMPIANSTASLHIEENGNVTGTWKLIRIDDNLTERYNFEGRHPLIQARLNRALRCKKDKCVLLAESGAESIARALLVETWVENDTSTILYCLPVGVAYFYPAITEKDIGEKNNGWMEMEVRLGHPERMEERNDTKGMEERKDTAWELITKLTRARGDEQSHHSDGVKTKGQESNTNSNVNTSDAHAATVQQVANGGGETHADVSVENRDKNSALISAAKDGDEQKVQFCLDPEVKPRADPNYQDEYGWTALHYAIWRRYPSLVKILTERDNVKVDIQDQRGQRPLHLAAERGDDEIVNLLLKRLSLDALNSQCEHDKQTALHRAAWGGSVAVVKLLLQKSVKADIKDKDENVALHIAAEKGFEPVVTRLIENSGLIDAKGWNNLTPLHYATMNGHLAVVQLLVDKKADIKAKDREFGWTALHLAAVNGHSTISECPFTAAKRSAVQPFLSLTLTSARLSTTSILTITLNPFTAAKCSAVQPTLSSLALTSVPAGTRARRGSRHGRNS
jgi:ankyrin repeat protein